MMTRFPIFVFLTVLGLVGCDTHSEHVWDEVVHQVQTPKVEQPTQAAQPAAALVNFDSSKSAEGPLTEPIPPKREKIGPAQDSSSFGHNLTLASKLYLSKAGELIGDLTIENNNFVSVKHITVHCVEYNMNNSVIREASITLANTLKVGESGYWDQVNFGYVHNDFETVRCKIAKAQLS